MRTATLTRYETSPNGTFGKVRTDNGFECYSAERDWHEGKKDISCIGAGEFKCQVVESPHFGKVYAVLEVPGRSDILLHPGNWPMRQSHGCILLGRAVGLVLGTEGLMSSRDALDGFMAHLDNEPFTLTIKWEPHIEPKAQA